ncbi:glycogen debranching protein GlgX [Falsirhodobacter xinxiangensis]|uniref:glycogen debranching protein GlgX n=1 Tax=Falsirhodobacter xinxiangensis TaxID=2530049 RepID=UPI0010AA98DE|nr:glycogen debranching protein GlgX [Rhodobacter xinxiangensis]
MLGAVPGRSGTRFSVFSAAATQMELCIFTPDEVRTRMRREGDIWLAEAEAPPGTEYGFRAHGEGPWFDPQKLLIDPYARALSAPLRDGDASARSVVCAHVSTEWQRPNTPWRDTVLYEAHVKGLTREAPGVRRRLRGTFRGMSSPAMLEHLRRLGVTAVELLPVQAFLDDRFSAARGLTNYWGYQTIGFFAPDPRYGTADDFRQMVRRFHGAGIEVILDVVYNHTGEGDETGPTIAFRGLDNDSYYRMDGARYQNDAGTGNTLDLTHPMVLRMVMDSLRFWVTEMGVDGFRFDLATVLGRTKRGFEPDAGFFAALMQDPVLRGAKLIAEPWDIGPGGYRLGQFPAPFAEWNDRFRDDLRRVWRGDAGMMPSLAKRLLGSAERFDHDRRGAWSSVNFPTSHDGFTLADLVSYSRRHNDANGEDGRDGHGENFSDNMGTEGPDPTLADARALRRRNLIACLMLSQGTPMLLAGDEMGNSQGGNNNAYAQDNPVGWVQWRDDPMVDFVARLTALRGAHPLLRQECFLHGECAGLHPNVIWRRHDGSVPAPGDWPQLASLGMELHGGGERSIYVFINPGGTVPLVLPDSCGWELLLDTTRPGADMPLMGLEAPAHSVLVFGANLGNEL